MKPRRRLLALAALAALAGCAEALGPPYQRGVAAFERGDVRTARVLFLNALQADPGNVEARIMQARVHLALGDGLAAEAELARAAESEVPPERIAHLLAEARLLQGDAQGALDRAAAAAPENGAYAARIRGRALAALDDSEGAGAAFEEAVSLDPADTMAWADLARFRRTSGDLAGAAAAADRAVAAGPANVEALVLRGEITRSQYGLAAALPWFDRALEIDPGHVTARLERAITYGDLGRMRDMLDDAREAHRLTGGHPTAYYLQAVLAARAGRFELARSVYNRAGGAFAAAPAGLLLEGAIDFGSGNSAQAAATLARLVEIQPGNRRARRLLAAALWRSGDSHGAVEALRPIVDRPDADAYSLSLAGRALAGLGENEEAALYLARAARPQPDALAAVDATNDAEFAELREAATAEPGHGPIQVQLVAALLARGRADEALARARRLQAAHPGTPDVHILVGDSLEAGGDFAGAAEQYRRAANLAFGEAVALRLIGALRRSGQSEAADRVLDLFLSQNPRNVSARILLAGRLMQARDWPGAIAVYEGLRARLGDNDSTLLNNLAWAHAESGDLESALPLARRAWALDRDNPATADTYGWILFKSGRRAEGLALLARAARGAPSPADLRRRLAPPQEG